MCSPLTLHAVGERTGMDGGMRNHVWAEDFRSLPIPALSSQAARPAGDAPRGTASQQSISQLSRAPNSCTVTPRLLLPPKNNKSPQSHFDNFFFFFRGKEIRKIRFFFEEMRFEKWRNQPADLTESGTLTINLYQVRACNSKAVYWSVHYGGRDNKKEMGDKRQWGSCDGSGGSGWKIQSWIGKENWQKRIGIAELRPALDTSPRRECAAEMKDFHRSCFGCGTIPWISHPAFPPHFWRKAAGETPKTNIPENW